jgi:hypothetical protein
METTDFNIKEQPEFATLEPQPMSKRGRKPKYESDERKRIIKEQEKKWREDNKEYILISSHYKESLPKIYEKLKTYVEEIKQWNEIHPEKPFDLSNYFKLISSLNGQS